MDEEGLYEASLKIEPKLPTWVQSSSPWDLLYTPCIIMYIVAVCFFGEILCWLPRYVLLPLVLRTSLAILALSWGVWHRPFRWFLVYIKLCYLCCQFFWGGGIEGGDNRKNHWYTWHITTDSLSPCSSPKGPLFSWVLQLNTCVRTHSELERLDPNTSKKKGNDDWIRRDRNPCP